MRFRLGAAARFTFLTGAGRLRFISSLSMFGLRSGTDRRGGRLRLFGSGLRALGSDRRGPCSTGPLLGLILLFGVRRPSFSFALVSLALLFGLLDFLGLVLDAGKIAKNFRPILRQLPLSAQLHFKQLLDNLIELRSTRNSQGIQFRERQRLTQWTPFLDVVAKFRDHARIGHFDFNEYQHFSWKRRDVEISVLRRVRFSPFEDLQDFLTLRPQIRPRLYLTRSKLHASHRRRCLTRLQSSKGVKSHRILQTRPQPRGV